MNLEFLLFCYLINSIACSIDSFPSLYQNRKFDDVMQYHFDKNFNTYEANPKHAFSVFYF